MLSKLCCGRLIIDGSVNMCENVGDFGGRDERGLKTFSMVEQGGTLWMGCLDLFQARNPWITWLNSSTKHRIAKIRVQLRIIICKMYAILVLVLFFCFTAVTFAETCIA